MRHRHVKVERDCRDCGGTGWVRCEDSTISIDGVPVKECKICLNSGQVEEEVPEPEYEPEDDER
jgi:hypothetical protein